MLAYRTRAQLRVNTTHLFGIDGGRIYVFGTDSFGRDELSRLLYGGQVSLTVGLIGIVISFSLGLLLGGVSGYFGGATDAVIMRGTELAGHFAKLHPAAAVLYMSGFTGDVLAQKGIREADVALLQKPFGTVALTHAVRTALGERV